MGEKFKREERKFKTVEGIISIGEIKNCIENDSNDFFLQSEIQRNYDDKRIKSDGVGFIGSLWTPILSTNETFSPEAERFIKNLRNVKEDVPVTDRVLFVNKHGKIFNAQHRTHWTMDYLNNKFSIPMEEVWDERIANKLWSEIKEENPSLAEKFLQTEFRVIVANVEGTTEGKLFSNINSSKPISKKDEAKNIFGGEGYKACKVFEESEENKILFSAFYPKAPVDTFFRAYCFITESKESKQIWRNLYISLNKDSDFNMEKALKILNKISKIYDLALKTNPRFCLELKEAGIHAVNAVMKIAYDESKLSTPLGAVRKVFSVENQKILNEMISYHFLDNDGEIIGLNDHSTTISVTSKVETILRNRLSI